MKKAVVAFILGTLLLLAGCTQGPITGSVTIDVPVNGGGTFKDTQQEICTQDSKPVIRFFGTSSCPHCKWIKQTLVNVAKEYVEEGQVVAYLWEVDTEDNLLTDEKEKGIPSEELELFRKLNPDQSVPTFIFGCKYIRIGNAFESQNNLAAEETEFRAVIDKLLGEVNT